MFYSAGVNTNWDAMCACLQSCDAVEGLGEENQSHKCIQHYNMWLKERRPQGACLTCVIPVNWTQKSESLGLISGFTYSWKLSTWKRKTGRFKWPHNKQSWNKRQSGYDWLLGQMWQLVPLLVGHGSLQFKNTHGHFTQHILYINMLYCIY